MIHVYFRRGAHRANKFSMRVCDIAARLERERKRGIFTVWVDGRECLEFRGPVYVTGRATPALIAIDPPGGLAAFPVLTGEEVANA